MMDNTQFLRCIGLSFRKFLETHPRSNAKLKILHGQIASDLSSILGQDYSISSLGFEKGKEAKIKGRYIDKNVDIAIFKDNKPIAGIGVKFVMQNYSQNSNNYFENMLGETANIRSCKIPYFQIFIIPDKIPYYNDKKIITRWETFSAHNSHKYLVLSKDNIETFVHTPTKTLLYVVKLPNIDTEIINKDEYRSYYMNFQDLLIEDTNIDYGTFDSSVIFNDFQIFMTKITHFIKSI